MNEKLIAPYSLLVEKDKEIEKLNREIGKLQAQLEQCKKRMPRWGMLPNVQMPYNIWYKTKKVLIWKIIIDWLLIFIKDVSPIT